MAKRILGPACTGCQQHISRHVRRRTTDERTGRPRDSGDFYACRCGELTFSPGQGEFNQRGFGRVEWQPA